MHINGQEHFLELWLWTWAHCHVINVNVTSHYVKVLTVNFNYLVFVCIRGSKKQSQSLHTGQLLYLGACSTAFWTPVSKKGYYFVILYCYIFLLYYVPYVYPVLMQNHHYFFLCTAHALIVGKKQYETSPW